MIRVIKIRVAMMDGQEITVQVLKCHTVFIQVTILCVEETHLLLFSVQWKEK